MSADASAELTPAVTKTLSSLHWYGHDAFRLDAGSGVIYFDPWQLPPGLPKADLILVSHDHSDHCSPEDVKAISKSGTVIVTVASAAAKLAGNVRTVKPGDSLEVHGVHISVVPAYNVNKFRGPGKPFHPKDAGLAGFVVTVDGVRVYHTGDSDFTPDMAQVKTDIALLPVSGTYVMTVEEAAKAADALKPALVVPMHVGRGIGTLEDAKKLSSLTSAAVRVLPMEEK